MSFGFNNKAYNSLIEEHEDALASKRSAQDIWQKGVEKVSNEKELYENLSLAGLAGLAMGINRWKGKATTRRQLKHKHSDSKNAAPDVTLLSMDIGNVSTNKDDTDLSYRKNVTSSIKKETNNTLIQYFAKISSSSNWEDNINLEYVAALLQAGADVNCKDAYGQTVLHEVARTWNTDVALYLINCGANVDAKDYLSRTPLHVAAAVNYPEMCQFLINNEADKEARCNAQQTPLFFAAKNDATLSLKCLIQNGCILDNIYDYRHRTPLYVAAELDRSETALFLVEHGADAFVQDDTTQIAFVPMVEKMPSVAKKALDQLHVTSRAQRRQRFKLYNLDPIKPKEFTETNPDRKREDENTGNKRKDRGGKFDLTDVDKKHIATRQYFNALKTITTIKSYPLIRNQTVKEYLNICWINFARGRAIREIALQLILIALWSVFAVLKEWQERYRYDLSQNSSEWYRILILILGILLTGYNIVDELREFYGEKKRHKNRVQKKVEFLEKDMEYCHDRWPEEKNYLIQEKNIITDSKVSYFEDWWNYLDWACYFFLVLSVVTHLIDVWYPGGQGNLKWARWHVRFMAVNVVILWMRLMKYVKPFEFFGPFIVMLGLIMEDIFKFLFLYIEFFVPFCCAFWIIMGGEDNMQEQYVSRYNTYNEYKASPHVNDTVTVDFFDTFNSVMFQLFRLTIVDEYDYPNMMKIDSITCQFLLGFWFAISAILFLNMFIAQLSETFKAVYDNAKAAASMQKAVTIVAYYDNMMLKYRYAFHQYILYECNPKYAEYDDDATDDTSQEELTKATLQMRESLNDLKGKFERLYENELNEINNMEIQGTTEYSGTKNKHTEQQQNLLEKLQLDQEKLKNDMKSMRKDMRGMKSLLENIAIIVAGGHSDEEPAQMDDDDDETDFVSGRRRRKHRRQSGRQKSQESILSPSRVINVQPSHVSDVPLNNQQQR